MAVNYASEKDKMFERTREILPDWNTLKNSRLLWYAVTTVVFAWLIMSANVEKFVQVLMNANYRYMLPAVIIGLAGMVIMGLVWHRFFRKIGIDTPLRKSVQMFMAGNLMNSVTPLGPFGGEPFMAYIVSSNTDSSYEKSLSAVISSDIVLAVPFITFLLAGIVYMSIFGFLENLMTQMIIISVVSMSLLLLAAYLLWFDGDRVQRVLNRIADFSGRFGGEESDITSRLKEKVQGFREALEKVGDNPRELFVTVIVSHLSAITDMIALYFVILAIGVEPMLMPIYMTVTIGTLGYFSPTPGGSGTFEAVFSFLMLFFFQSVSPDQAVAAAILFRVATYWVRLPPGYISLLFLRSPDR